MRALFLHWCRLLLLSCGYLLLNSCEQIDFSPYQVILESEQRDLNKKNLARIAALSLQPQDTLRFGLISDNQRFYNELEDVVKALNAYSAQEKRLHFVINCGDLTDFGLQEEYVWQLNRTKKLKMPYLAIIGNHDCVANGKKIYQAMYGPMDFTFEIAGSKFVVLNTNSLEFSYPVPEMEYMRQTMANSHEYRNLFVLSHVPPFDTDFNKDLKAEFAQLLRIHQVPYSIHGHQHNFSFSQPFQDGQDYLVVDTIQNRNFIVVTVVGKQVSFQKIDF
ncbi:metallophosphoesterase [Adhaeribacter arboris]|uniref:Metallophosphoesterase n=1 Tax=Adhaeribacter arboris TaxID=2072846 RepID=A0A2T2YN44_9BACT|nr:metallophosphoesterase [Adhaeribacter arboris]PSR56899.1 metallophosphoesterase [Adhaeribacter arboris]